MSTRQKLKIDWIGARIPGLLLAGALFLAFAEIVARYVFRYSFYWSEEIVIYMVIWSTFFAVIGVTEKGEHIKVEFFIRKFSYKNRVRLDMFVSLLGLLFVVYLLFSGLALVIDASKSEVESISLLQTPLFIPYSIVPIGAGLLMIKFIKRIIKLIINPAPADVIVLKQTKGAE